MTRTELVMRRIILFFGMLSLCMQATAGVWNYETAKASYLFALIAADPGGATPDGPVSDKCLTCNGTGKWMLDGRPQGTCPDCDGSGRNDSDPQSSDDKAANELLEVGPPGDDVPQSPTPKPPAAQPIPYARGDWKVTEWSAPWCGYCIKFQKVDQPIIEQAGVDVTEPIDTDARPALTKEQGITNIPVFDLVCKRDGFRHKRLTGYHTAAQILRAIDDLCKDKNGKEVKALPGISITQAPPTKITRPAYPANNRWRTHFNGVYYDTVARTGSPQQVANGKTALINHMRSEHGTAQYKGWPLTEYTLMELYWMHCDEHPPSQQQNWAPQQQQNTRRRRG
jgi:hypothetical protein